MDGKQLNKLIRVLAQTGSDNDHVALEALRAAQRAVADDGSHWTEFTRSLVDGEFRILATNITVLRRQIERLKTQLRQARAGLPPVPR